MLRFIKLAIKGPKDKLQNILAQWKADTPKGWKYDKTRSRDMAMNLSYIGDEEWAFFNAPKKLYGSSLCLVVDDEALRVVNITSDDYFYLTKEQYNEVLMAFYKDFIDNKTTHLLQVQMTSPEQSLEELINKETALKLRRWEMSCNKSDGGLCHPYDREMWFDFIATAVRTRSGIDLDILEQWLVEEQKWPDVGSEEDSRTEKLLLYFEYGRDLVQYYEQNIH